MYVLSWQRTQIDLLWFSRVGSARELVRSISGFWLTAMWVMFLLASLACNAAVSESSLEDRAQALNKSFICPICPSETLDQSQVELAKQMRSVIRSKLLAGWTEPEIKQFFVDRYGEEILIVPEKYGINMVVWVVPPVTITMGLGIVFIVIRLMTRRFVRHERRSHVYWNEEDEGVEKYLSIIDDERDR